jgi:uncharacterized damage-inducible protein DinB
MHADAFRRIYDYHFGLNRRLWHHVMELSDEDFDREHPYSHGSVRNQVWHLMTVDEGWFTELRNGDWPDYLQPGVEMPMWPREQIRARWDEVETMQREWLAGLTDEALFEHPWSEGEDAYMVLWEVLFHVVNHGTDHRAQTQRLLSDLGVTTYPIDYGFFASQNPLP